MLIGAQYRVNEHICDSQQFKYARKNEKKPEARIHRAGRGTVRRTAHYVEAADEEQLRGRQLQTTRHARRGSINAVEDALRKLAASKSAGCKNWDRRRPKASKTQASHPKRTRLAIGRTNIKT